MLNPRKNLSTHLSFKRFWGYCAEQLGSSRLDLNLNATTLADFCGSMSFSDAVLKDVVHQTFKRNGCKSLNDSIALDATFDVLGEIAFALHQKNKDDLISIELLEEVGWCLNQCFPKPRTKDSDEIYVSSERQTHNLKVKQRAKIHSIQLAKLRKANARV